MQALVSIFRRGASSRAEPGQAEGIALLASGKWTLELLKRLEWRRLEELCAAYFARPASGASSCTSAPTAAPQICLYAAGASEASILVHCKPWDAYPIGLKALRELRGAVGAANGPEVVFVTTGRFTPEAKAFAAKERVELIDGAALLEKLAAPGAREGGGPPQARHQRGLPHPHLPALLHQADRSPEHGPGTHVLGLPQLPALQAHLHRARAS